MIRKILVIVLIISLNYFSLRADDVSRASAIHSCMQSCYKKSDMANALLSTLSFASLIGAIASGKTSSGNNRIIDLTGFERYPTDPRYKNCYSSCQNSNPSFDKSSDGEIHPRYNNSLFEYINRGKKEYKY